MSTRAYGDDMISNCVYQLQLRGVEIEETANSGAKYGNCDAIMERGGLALEGKSSMVSQSVTGVHADLTKAHKQARKHNRYPALIVENCDHERWVYMFEDDFNKGLGVDLPELMEYELNTKSWSPMDDDIHILINNNNERVIAMPWKEFKDLVIGIYGERDD